MIRVDFVPPCFECEVEDADGQVLTELHIAPDEATLRAALNARVAERRIHAIISVKPYDFEQRWRERAREATKRAIAARKLELEAMASPKVAEGGKEKKFEFDSSVWSDLKDHLIRLFHHKCAYCEAPFAHVDFGDVEHFRPKKRVEEDRSHPGYYWLAYDERNLLPSCKLCNQARAKMNHFPIAGTRARCEDDDLDAEDPLLLNPYRDDPEDHLEFIPGFGTVAAKVQGNAPSEKGEMSRRTYRLNREHLMEVRRTEQARIRLQVKDAIFREDREALDTALRKCKLGVQPFSRATVAEIRAFFKSMGWQPSPI